MILWYQNYSLNHSSFSKKKKKKSIQNPISPPHSITSIQSYRVVGKSDVFLFPFSSKIN